MLGKNIDSILAGPFSNRVESAWKTFLKHYSTAIAQVITQYESNRDRIEEYFLFMCGKLSDDEFRRLIEGSWTGDKIVEDRELLTDDEYPEYTGVYRLGSGSQGDREKLAFRHNGDCRTISVIDVADCEAGPTNANPRPCEAEAQFFGTQPSWTDRGTIIYEIAERGGFRKKEVTPVSTPILLVNGVRPVLK